MGALGLSHEVIEPYADWQRDLDADAARRATDQKVVRIEGANCGRFRVVHVAQMRPFDP
jgi:hypothetical protein